MIFAEVFVFLLFVLAAVFVIRVAARKWRRAGVVGKMHEIEEVEELAGNVSKFQKDHKNPDAAQQTVDKFTQGR